MKFPLTMKSKTYDHGGLVLRGRDHFAQYLRSAPDWLDRHPGFKIGEPEGPELKPHFAGFTEIQ